MTDDSETRRDEKAAKDGAGEEQTYPCQICSAPRKASQTKPCSKRCARLERSPLSDGF